MAHQLGKGGCCVQKGMEHGVQAFRDPLQMSRSDGPVPVSPCLGIQAHRHLISCNCHRPFEYHYPSVSSGDWLQKPPQIPKSMDAQVPYIKWYSTMNTVGPLVSAGFAPVYTECQLYNRACWGTLNIFPMVFIGWLSS